MSAFYLTFLAVLLSGLAARDQITAASLSQIQGRRPAVLIIGMVLAIATAAFAGWAATVIVPLMQPAARVFLCALALGFAGGESVLLTPRAAKGEPTQSLSAYSFVLLAHQLTDAARFVIFGIAVATNAPVPVAGGGALGGIALLCFGWAFPQIVLHPRMRVARRLIGVGFLLLAAYVAMRALDWI